MLNDSIAYGRNSNIENDGPAKNELTLFYESNSVPYGLVYITRLKYLFAHKGVCWLRTTKLLLLVYRQQGTICLKMD